MTILRIAAFSDNLNGGNPAGVMISDQLPSKGEMQKMAADIGYSETVFAAQQAGGKWMTRYFSPESEVPFCGHATIALGAVLAEKFGTGINTLSLSHAEITVEGSQVGNLYSASLQSPPTKHKNLSNSTLDAVLDLFNYNHEDIADWLSPASIHAGANHIVIALKSREKLAAMNYDLEAGRSLMNEMGLVTIMFVWQESERLFHVRNAFASGGVFEDPATGAAAAAFAGYLRDSGKLSGGEINIVQGEDMGARSLINAHLSGKVGSSIRVSGTARYID